MKNKYTFTIKLKPALGFENIVTSFTYMVFIEQLKGLISGLGLRYKISEDSRFVTQSDNWKD